MNFPSTNISTFHNEILQQTRLGQLCSEKGVFRNRYQILRMLGRGGFGVTFLARDIRLPGKPLCVIKQLCPQVSHASALKSAQKRFEREARTLSLLGSHSQIPMLLDYFILEEEFYLVQEYVKGITLARMVRRQGAQSEAFVRNFLRGILPILSYIHAQGVIHRDIKPQNIICCQEHGRLVLIDFGAVKESMAENTHNTSIKGSTSHFIGTVGFAPPEQFYLRPVYASDIFAVGVTCVYLLTGKAPLDLESDRRTGELKWQHLVEINDCLLQILNKMLRPTLAERYTSAAEVLDALDLEVNSQHLFECLNVQNRPQLPDSSGNFDAYEPYHIKTAKAIREWKERFASGQVRRQRQQLLELLNKSQK